MSRVSLVLEIKGMGDVKGKSGAGDQGMGDVKGKSGAGDETLLDAELFWRKIKISSSSAISNV